MILVDTSIWIELFAGRIQQFPTGEELPDFATCGPIIQEVLQGIRPAAARQFQSDFEALPRLCDPLPERLFVHAAEIFRLGRVNGYTIRSSQDCLIAAIALESGLPVWHQDRDFDHIAKFTELQVVSSSLRAHG